MPNIEQLKNRLAKLQKQTLETEAAKKEVSTTKLIFTDGSAVEDYPLITCPACGEVTEVIEGRLDHEHKSWGYFETICESCNTNFRLGEVDERCALCRVPFPSDPYYDINELNHHWCDKDGQDYCTSCFMQLFFDGYIDLSSNNSVDTSDNSQIAAGPPCTHVGHSLGPYHSRLAVKGFEEAAVVKEWDEVIRICQQVLEEDKRYLILYKSSEEPGQQNEYVIYRTREKNSKGGVPQIDDNVLRK